MSNRGIKNNGLTGLELLVVQVLHPALMGYLIRPQQVVIKQWIKRETKVRKGCKQDCNWVLDKEWAQKRKYRQRMKKIWDEIGVFPVAEQRLADQARQIRINMWLKEIKIEEIRRKLERQNSKVEVQDHEQEIIEHNVNKPG